MLTQSRLKYLLDYDQTSGVFTRAVKTSNRVAVGDIAGCVKKDGYRYIRLDSAAYLAHRLAWLYVYGSFPIGMIDHRNMVRSDNRISNLREASDSENVMNRPVQANNVSGCTGVYQDKRDLKWQAEIKSKGVKYCLGRFFTREEAVSAYSAAARILHKEFFNPGKLGVDGENSAALGRMMDAAVLQVIEREKRPGGTLYQ